MKITKSAIHKLTATANCGCSAWGEYQDPVYKQKIGTLAFTPCTTHTATPEAYADILKEVVEREASEAKLPEPEQPHRSHRPPAREVPSEGGEAALGEPRPAPKRQGVSLVRPGAAAGTALAAAGAGAPRMSVASSRPAGAASSTGGMTETRTPIAPSQRRAEPAPGAGKRAGIGRVDPNAGSRAAGLNKAAAAPLSMDMGESVAEDQRVTKLLEVSGVLDMDGDEGDLDFGDE